MAAQLHAQLLADHVYRDADSGKFVLAGTFHHVRVAAFPSSLSAPPSVFVGISGVDRDVEVKLEFRTSSGDVLLASHDLSVCCEDPTIPIEFALELPPLPLPGPGRFALALAVDGKPFGELPVIVEGPGVSEDLAVEAAR